jgi:hypothetical protein
MYFSYLREPPPPHPYAGSPGPLGGGSNTILRGMFYHDNCHVYAANKISTTTCLHLIGDNRQHFIILIWKYLLGFCWETIYLIKIYFDSGSKSRSGSWFSSFRCMKSSFNSIFIIYITSGYWTSIFVQPCHISGGQISAQPFDLNLCLFYGLQPTKISDLKFRNEAFCSWIM